MRILVIECSPSLIVDTRDDPDNDRFIYAHLKYYCSKFSPLPAISAMFVDGQFLISRGHKYLRIARELGRSSIRVIVEGGDGMPDIERFLKSEGVQRVDWSEIDQREQAALYSPSWHVFFFVSPLTKRAMQEFVAMIKNIFEGTEGGKILSPVAFTKEGQAAEFEALTPHGNHQWSNRFLAACRRFHSEYSTIESYQGRRFFA